MRLFLSSQDLGNYPEELLKLVGNRKKVAFINNAKDYLRSDERAAKSEEKISELRKLGFEATEIDLRNYFGKADELANNLTGFGLIWCSGGNTFILRRALAQSGLDKIIVDNLKKDKFVYGGSSAGSIIPTPSLRGTEYGDDPNTVPADYDKAIIWEGLGLVPFYIVPHYESDWFGGEANAMVKYMRENKLPFKALTDGQVVIVEGDKTEVLK